MKTDRLSLQEDLHSARDMNAKLDGSKEQVARQLAAKSLENDQVRFGYKISLCFVIFSGVNLKIHYNLCTKNGF